MFVKILNTMNTCFRIMNKVDVVTNQVYIYVYGIFLRSPGGSLKTVIRSFGVRSGQRIYLCLFGSPLSKHGFQFVIVSVVI